MEDSNGYFKLANRNWVYRGEGNSNIVLSLQDEKKVLRLRKSIKGKLIDTSQMEKKLQLEIKFINSVMRCLLTDAFVTAPTVVSLKPTDVEMINTALESLRPENRRDGVLSLHFGTLFPDYTYLPQGKYVSSSPTYCIELKPKQGAFPLHRYKLKKCAFCLKQYLKLREGMAQEQSFYCPLDLFSGDTTRMRHAVLSLLSTPQNNLRIFKDGVLVFGEGDSPNKLQCVLSNWLTPRAGISEQDRFASLLLGALTKELATSTEVEEPSYNLEWKWDGYPQGTDPDSEQSEELSNILETLPPPSCNFSQNPLPTGCILQLLHQAQALDVSGPAQAYEMYVSHLKHKNIERTSSVDEEYNYVQSILQKSCSSQLSPIESYLISATARDCSLLISFQEIKNNDEEFQLPTVDDVSSLRLAFNIGVVDLDPKPLSCIERHHFRDAAIYKACQEAAVEKKCR